MAQQIHDELPRCGLRCLLIGLAAAGVVGMSSGAGLPNDPPASAAERAEPVSRPVAVSWVTDTSVFPESWRAPRWGLTVVPPREDDKAYLEATIAQAVSKYPPGFFETYMDSACFAGVIRAEGRYCRSLRDERTIYLSSLSRSGAPFHSAVIEREVHFALCRAVLIARLDMMDLGAWGLLLPDGFDYRSTSSDRALAGLSTSELQAKGFLCPHATASLAGDFSCITSAMMDNEPAFWDAYRKNPVLRAKVRLVLEFFHRVDERLTLQHFRDLPRVGRSVRIKLRFDGTFLNVGRPTPAQSRAWQSAISGLKSVMGCTAKPPPGPPAATQQ
ncbi:MAG: hypothetical protein KF745_07855 [Phycisphaeraceae bacterium]|nr:hypothetical protein [Phycisphaeraceae bacterium]